MRSSSSSGGAGNAGNTKRGKTRTALQASDDLLRRAVRVKREGAIRRGENARATETSMLEVVAIYFELAER